MGPHAQSTTSIRYCGSVSCSRASAIDRATTAINARDAADSLVGRALDATGIARAADLAAEAAQPQSDHRGSAAYKRHVVHTFVIRLLTRVVDGQGSAEPEMGAA